MNIPAEIQSGDLITWRDDPWTDNLGNQIDSAFTLTYILRGLSGVQSVLTITGTTYGQGWESSITAAQSAALPEGDYFWQAYATSGTNRKTGGSGRLKVLPNFAVATAGFDGRTQNEKDLDAVTRAIRDAVFKNASEYTIQGRQLKKIPMSDLITIQSYLAIAVTRERKAQDLKNGLPNKENLFIRFKGAQ